jgi:hypothetical protein
LLRFDGDGKTSGGQGEPPLRGLPFPYPDQIPSERT